MKENDLPNDVGGLKSIVFSLQEKIQLLEDTILILQRKKFARSSEKDPNQQDMFNEIEEEAQSELTEDESDLEDDEEEITYKRKKGKRSKIPEDLPRVEEIIDLTDEEKIGMKLIGEEICEKLEITPAKVYVRRIIRKKYAPIDKNNGSPVIAPEKEEILPKTMASASLIAYIITAKFCDALPLYRQEKIFERFNAYLTRQTMARWLIQVSEKLLPLYNLLQDMLLELSYMKMDETPTQVLNEDGRKATSKSYMWVRYGPSETPIILFDYAPTRSGDVPLELLNGFKGYLQIDGYDGYSRAIRTYNLTRVGCWDHCRRKFFDASKTSKGKSIGKRGIAQIKELYKIEKKIANLHPDEKKKIRDEKSRPILIMMKEWIDEWRSKTVPDSYSGKALNYAYNEWQYLIAYLEDGRIDISNCHVENAIRPFCLGKKNWLFSASVAGAKASSIFYSLIETAKANGIEPFDYFLKMLEKLPLAQTVEDFDSLLPIRGKFKT